MLIGVEETQFQFPKQTHFYRGKVRDVYTIDNQYMVMVVTDRISAFDVVLPKPIPYKGQVLNQIAAKNLAATQDIVPNWVIDIPHPNVTIGKICTPFKVEMVIRGYLSGHAWRTYQSGKRILCGVHLPEGLSEHDCLPQPIITPTTKASEGHDEDISREEILRRGIVTESDYVLLEQYTQQLFAKGTAMAAERGLILVDTKYEFGKIEDQIYLIDEIHTPDSSRYFYADGYLQRQERREPQKQLSKEFVREWLIEQGFQGQEGQKVPVMTEDKIIAVSERYVELYENIVGESFVPANQKDIIIEIEQAVLRCIQKDS